MDRLRKRSPLHRVSGLGSEQEVVRHWWLERATAVALAPLTLWLVASFIALPDSHYVTIIAWLASPLIALPIVLLHIVLFTHLAMGLQVVIEDYVHSGAKIPSLMAVRLISFILGAAGIVATLRIFFNL